MYVVCSALVGLATLCYEGNDLDQAEYHALEAIAVSQAQHLLADEVHATVILARVCQARGQLAEAREHLSDLLVKIPVSAPHLAREIRTAQVRLALATGDWLPVHGWPADREPHPRFAHACEEELLHCRRLQSQGEIDEAWRHLERLAGATEEAGATRLAREVRLEMALVAAERKHLDQARELVGAVLVPALAGNAIRPFLDAGEVMAILLRTLLPRLTERAARTALRTLLSAFPPPQPDGSPAQAAALIEPLSPQELRVLRLLAQHRSNAEIAAALVVSVNTIRTQVRSIYGKLGVHTRGAAGEAARELHLV